MTREQVIDCMTDGAVNRPFGVASTIREKKRLDMVAALAALDAAGMVVVPREPTEAQDQAGHNAYHWFNKMTEQKQVQRHNIWQTIYRAMTEAHNE